jgi:large subunit ribosomal protein L25
MAVISLKGEARNDLGKGGARKARAAGQIPCVVYGHGETPVPVNIGARDFEVAMRHHHGGNAIVNLAVSDRAFTALIRDVQYDPLTHGILHLDFQQISLTETVEVKVAVHLIGLPIGVKEGGGVLELIMREIPVQCLPTAIPASLDVDVSHLIVGQSVHVSDLKAPDVTVLADAHLTVATVVAPTVVEEKPAEEVVAAEGAAAEPEVITKGKKEEGDEKGDKKDDKKEDKKDKAKA